MSLQMNGYMVKSPPFGSPPDISVAYTDAEADP